jgi:integrase
VRELDRIEQPKGQARKKPPGPTVDERQGLLEWFDLDSDDDRVRRLQRVARAAELPELVRFSLGTGLRIGEALAVRRLDVNLDGVLALGQHGPLRVPVATIAGNVTWVKGKGLVRHDGKSEAALRVIPLPRFAADLLRGRLVQPGEDSWPSAAAGRSVTGSQRTLYCSGQTEHPSPTHSATTSRQLLGAGQTRCLRRDSPDHTTRVPTSRVKVLL